MPWNEHTKPDGIRHNGRRRSLASDARGIDATKTCLIQFEDGEEGFLGHFDVADLFHTFLTAFLLLE